ncbi:hypothetical protein NLG97_g3322 [Lecanicillium saksenae]|uniref:Uncharacterized protein n=1 Tax=Lecanicillium saksenae TaxID=468837 RepID=A0ACC1R1S7_9HYPO|nr:hypothetical protein NLG97_g3322 [Lecanicillium saksenae]
MATNPALGLPWQAHTPSKTALRFEDAILTFLPSCVVFLLTPALLLRRSHRRVRFRRRWLLWLKLGFAACVIVFEVASLMARCTSIDFNYKEEFPTFTVDLMIAISVGFIIYREHCRAVRASALLGLHLALSVVIDITKSRSFLRRPDTHASGSISTYTAIARLMVLVLEEIPRGAAFVDGQLRGAQNSEASGGFWGKALFLWLNSTLFLGFRSRLTVDDIDDIAPEFSSEALSQIFKSHWQHAETSTDRSLATICSRILSRSALAVVLPRLAFTAFALMQPFLLQRLLSAVENDDLAKYTQQSLVHAAFIVYFGLAASRAAYEHMSCRLITQLRGILTAEVLDKSHTLSQAESMKAAAVSLITNDIEAVATGVPLVCEIPFHLVEVVLSMSCLAFFVGKSCFVVIIPLLFSMTLASIMAKYSGPAMAAWNEKISQRVSQTSKVLSQLKVIKMLGLGPTVATYLQGLREGEVASSKKYLTFHSLLFASQMFTSTITPVLVVGAALFWGFMTKLATAQIVPCLAAVALIQRPLYRMLAVSSKVATMFACLTRIQAYLELEENDDPRIVIEPVPAVVPEDSDEKAQAPTSWPIEFVDVTLLCRDSESQIIEQASFTLERGSITAALGPSGSGKTALLQSIVGDANIADGFLYVDSGVIGYADQSPWLRSVSIRENIVGSLIFDVEWYMIILKVCLLVEDLKHLPGGDMYYVGTNGMNLSGGQRHRISLARALYCRASILVLDDIFSALDRKTAVSILFQLCGENGLLRTAGCTVILATYLPESLDVVDQLLLLDGKGGVTIEREFQEECFRTNLVNALRDQAAITVIETEDKEKLAMKLHQELQSSTASSACKTPTAKRNSHVSLYTFCINSTGRVVFTSWLFVVFLVSLSETIPEVFIRVWTEVAPESMAYFAGYAGASIFATVVVGIAQVILYYVLAPRSSTGLHEKLTQVVMRSTLGYFSCTDTSSILNRYSEDMNATMRGLPAQVFRFFYMLFHVTLQVGIISFGTMHMAIMLPFVVSSVAIVLFFYVRTSRQMRHMELETKTPLYNHFTETASGLRHIRALGWRSANMTIGLTRLDTSQKVIYMASSMRRWLGLVVDLLTCGVCVMLTSMSITHRHDTSVSAIGLSFLILITFGLSLDQFIDSWADLDRSINAFSRLRDFMHDTPTEPDLAPVNLPPNWPQLGAVELRNVTAKYRNDAPASLEDISLRVMSGNKAGITGRTGSGKSSLFMSMLGFLEYTGVIEIDGIDISQIPRDTLRSRIITISQDHLDLGGTVRNNLLPFNLNLPAQVSSARDDEINDVLERVGLSQRIDRQGGLDTQLSKIGLSHGQLQLLSIARAILRSQEIQSKVVLIDEATSNVDLDTDAAIQKVLRHSFQGCTILMIAHRLETVQDADMFIELAHGKASVVKS